jgi:8-oxo-dGTP pyrophosphatase MutT (NUDIX family)
MKMKYRSYVFTVVFHDGKILVLHRTKNWRGWELPKGGLKDGENVANGLRREVFEETGSRKFKIIAKTRHFIRYRFPRGYVKDNHIFFGAKGYLFLVKALESKIKVDRDEHDGFRWATKDEAMKLLTHRNQRNALEYVSKRYSLE